MVSVLLLSLPLLLNYNLVSSLVTNYRIVTWNSNGYRLTQVFDLFANNSTLDLVFVQESGNVASNLRGNLITTNLPEFIIADAENEFPCNDVDDFLEVRSIQHQNMQLYVYNFPSGIDVNNKISQTIVSRHRAAGILYFISQHNRRNICHDRTFTNRPIPGLVINNDIFLNMHAEPVQNRNEVLTQLGVIRSHMNLHRRSASWLLVGDFNREPPTVTPNLNAQERLVSPSQPTYLNKVYDYLIYGSSNLTIFTLMSRTQYRATVDNRLQGSDHNPVYFTY